MVIRKSHCKWNGGGSNWNSPSQPSRSGDDGGDDDDHDHDHDGDDDVYHRL